MNLRSCYKLDTPLKLVRQGEQLLPVKPAILIGMNLDLKIIPFVADRFNPVFRTVYFQTGHRQQVKNSQRQIAKTVYKLFMQVSGFLQRSDRGNLLIYISIFCMLS